MCDSVRGPMCFSPEADLAAGISGQRGRHRSTVERAHSRRTTAGRTPLLLGVHQLIEAFVWWGLEGKVPASLGDTAIWVYLAVAFLLPLWVPLAVRGVEPSPGRRPIMALLVGVGLVVSLVLLGTIVWGPVDAAIVGHHIAYSVDIPGVGPSGSSTRWRRAARCSCRAIGGSAPSGSNVIAVVLLVWLTVGGLTSLWCVWAAVTSVAIDLFLRDEDRTADVVFA